MQFGDECTPWWTNAGRWPEEDIEATRRHPGEPICMEMPFELLSFLFPLLLTAMAPP